MIKENFLILIVGPTASGKSSIYKKLLKIISNVNFSISYTTRKKRENEQDGVDYYFISQEEFENKIENKEFIEFAKVHDNYYGTSKKTITDSLNKNQHLLLDVDVQGANNIIKSNFPYVSIFVLPPSLEDLKNRLINRGSETKVSMEIRLTDVNKELKEINKYDYLLINNNLEEAVEKVIDIIKVEELKIIRLKNILEDFYSTKN